ncbi:MAG: hypothetical protein NT152_04635 [Actinobacteria bacterium]|nr:hypothetical protein [Actinomycetota bacterium]
MPRYFIGIDGGGTKTHACLVDESGKIIASAANGAANWERIGINQTEIALNQVIDETLTTAKVLRSDVAGYTFALAGIDWDSDSEMFAPFVATNNLGERASFINDSVAALYAGIPSGIGCASIAGTGGKTVGHDGKKSARTMGMSLGEGGGAGQLMDVAINRMARAENGQAGKTRLTQVLPTHFGMNDIYVFFKAIAREAMSVPEELAPVVFELANEGDAGAIEVCEIVARQHAQDVVGIANLLNFENNAFDVVRAGGLHTANLGAFNSAFESVLASSYPLARPIVLDIAPVIGAAIHAAAQILGPLPEPFLKQVFSGARQVAL